jgi:uncharacterized protein
MPDSGRRSELFSVMEGAWAVARLGATDALPNWALNAQGFVSTTRTAEELSVVCPEKVVPTDVRAERGWAILKVEGPFPFNQVGVLASFAAPLAEANISLFAVSSYDTDYILVKLTDLERACDALASAGHRCVAR